MTVKCRAAYFQKFNTGSCQRYVTIEHEGRNRDVTTTKTKPAIGRCAHAPQSYATGLSGFHPTHHLCLSVIVASMCFSCRVASIALSGAACGVLLVV